LASRAPNFAAASFGMSMLNFSSHETTTPKMSKLPASQSFAPETNT